MPRKQLSRIATPESLARIEPLNLAELLKPHVEFLDRHGIDAGAHPSQRDLTRLSEILLDPGHDVPDSLIDALLHIDEMADEDGMQKLMEAVEARGIDLALPPLPTPADVATRVWLRCRDVIERAHVEHRVLRTQSFGIYLRGPGKGGPGIADIDSRVASLEEALRAHHAKRHRGAACRLFHFMNGDVLTIAIRRGGTLRREGCIENDEPSTVQYQPIRFECIVLDLADWELRMTRGSKRDTAAYREAVGAHLAGDPAFFEPYLPKFNLDPIMHDGRGCLICNDIVGISRVQLVEVEIDHDDGIGSRDIKRSDDLFRAFETQAFRLPPGARITRARFAFTFDDSPRKPRTAEVSVWNRLRCSRSCDAAVVNEFLRKRGFFAEADHVALASA